MRPWSAGAAGRRRDDGFRVRGGATTRVEAFVDAAFALSDSLVRIGVPGFVLFGINVGQWSLDRRRARVLGALAHDATTGPTLQTGAHAVP